jgi:RNA polymerase sigma factor (sigma-70 family)
MAAGELSEVVGRLRRAVLRRDGPALTDGQLLECFLSSREEAAVAALVQRHGPMVWGVCRRVVCNHHDAEDAFQATFLVLVRKAASIVPREMVANWLYGVAHQTALKARATAARRRGRERQVTQMPEPAAAEQDQWHDLQPLLDEELSRLPDRYRAVVVLCDLEGKTRKEAARRLGVPEGSVAGWLARARTMLAKRLTQRGVALSGGALAAVVSQKAASAGVPLSVVSSTIKAATLFAAGQAAAGVISVKVAALTEGVVKTMLLNNLKLKAAMTVLLMASVAGLGVGGLFYQTQAAEPTASHAALKPVLLAQKAEPVQQQDKQQKQDKSDLGFRPPRELPERYKQIYPVDDLLIPGLPFLNKRTDRLTRETEFLEKLLRIEAAAVPFPDDDDEAIRKDLGFFPPAKALLDKSKADARKKASAKLQAIAEIEASLKKLAESTDDKSEREALESIEKAVKQMKEALGKVYPRELLKVKDKEDKK